ncbi:MAG: T9SS type A sorting domain-containing protein [Bacteroidetes bacterium]|nr:T9SS type A sorting domain-containing protein [Bacteroidota bacterium]
MNTLTKKIISFASWFLLLTAHPAFGQTITTIFDEDPLSASFRDASWGTFSGAGEYLKLAGGSGDKAPITTAAKFSGNQSILLEAKHVTGGSWNLFIASNAWASRDFSLYDTLIFYINTPDSLAASELPLLGLESENSDSKSATVNIASYIVLDSSSATWQRCAIPFTAFQPYGNFLLSKFKTVRFINNGTNPANRTIWIDLIAAVSNKTINKLLPTITEERLLDTLQYTAFRYFWEQANPLNGLVKDRSTTNSGASIAATGFGVSAICIAIDRGWVTREAGRSRVQAIINTFHDGPQGTGGSGTIGYKGWFYHFLDMNTATRAGFSELSTIDTGLLLAGLIHAREYFDGQDAAETEMRQKVDAIQSRIDWQWILNGNIIRHGWSPESGMIPWGWGGYSEAMILYVLGLGSPTAPIPTSSWNTWTSTYPWITYAGYSHVGFAALFGHQYSQSWIDFRNIKDAYMTAKGIDYFENSRRATMANRAFCIANPGGYKGYSDSLWGLTACDGPTGYKARGGPNGIDDGTIAPTAAISSMPFTPAESKKFAKAAYEKFGTDLFGPYGFRDAFNEHFAWFGTDYIGIDQGPIIIMIENYRTGKVWNAFMKNQTIRNGLVRAGFSGVVSVPSADVSVPGDDYLRQNYPNPFNPVTTITYSVRSSGPVTLSVYNTLGQRIATLVDRIQTAGEHSVPFDASELPSGIYYYRLQSERFTAAGMMTLVK